MPRPRMARPPLTKRAIDAAKPQKKDHFLWDGAEHGLGVKVTPAGSRVFILQKHIRGRLRRITLGQYGDLTLDAARTRARQLNGEIASGRDPVADAKAAEEERRRVESAEKTMADLWDRYVAEVVAVENKQSTAAEKNRLWTKRIAPKLGGSKIKDVTDQAVGEVVRSPLRFDLQGRVVAGRAEAGNVYRLLHHLFRKAIGWGLRSRAAGNPLDTVTAPRAPRRERLLTSGEVGALLRTVGEMEAEGATEAAPLIAIRAAILTGARISEILSLRWAHVRREESELRLPDTKTGFSRRPISAEAMAVLEAAGRAVGSAFVFRSATDPTAPLTYGVVEKVFRRVRERAGVEACSLHSLRHWFATTTANSVSNPRVGMALTGHRSHAAYMNYVHSDREQARTLADQIGTLAVSLAAAPPNVVPIRKTGGG